jgi:ferredoxin-NADP reductase
MVDSRAFLAAVRALVLGGERERLEFAFRLYADDADGSISEPELLRMIAISSAESSDVSQPPDELAKALFRAADADRDGRLSFDEFARALRKHPKLLRRIIRSEALGIAPNEALLQRLAASPQCATDAARPSLVRALDNHRYDLLALAVWLLTNLVVFRYGLGHAARLPSPAAVPGAGWVRLARAFGACLSFNAALVFLPLMRHLVAHLRQTWWGRKLDVDRAAGAHHVLGHVIFGLAWAHALAYALAFESGHHALGMGRMLTRTYPGSTGALLLLVFTGLWSLALVRARSFDRLDRAYRLYALLWALIVIHAPSFLIWAVLPVAGLAFELLSRRRKRSRQALVREIVPLRAGVTRITIERPAAFRFEAGNYVFFNLPNIAKHVWHPFNVSSHPEQSDLTLHAQNQDEWTVALRFAAEARAKRSYQPPWLAHIDGPHGGSSARIFHARNAVLIGAGNGITPLASILSSIVARTSGRRGAECELQNVQFFWLNRDPYAYEWFSAQLTELERTTVPIRIGVHACFTGGGTGSTSAALEVARELQQQTSEREHATGLRTTTHTGHPDWRIVLTAIAEQHAPEPVEVFFCGPPGLAAKLHGHCAHIGLRFHEEKF